MSDGTYRGRWVGEVFRTPHVSAEVKVFLLYLATYHMDEGGRVSEPRENLAAGLNCHPRNITAKFKAAIGAGLMEQTARGQKHQTAVYRALVPGLSQGDDCRHPEKTAQGDSSRHPERSQGATDYHPERDSQGGKNQHPEAAQGDDTRPAESSQGDDSRHPTYREQVEEGDNGEVAEVISLFEEEKIKPPPADGAAAPRPEKSLTDAQKVVGAYIEGVKEATGQRPDRRRIGHISKQAKTQLEEENRDCTLLTEAARSLGRKVGRNFTDLGAEYLIVAAAQHAQPQPTPTSGSWPSRRSGRNVHHEHGAGEELAKGLLS